MVKVGEIQDFQKVLGNGAIYEGKIKNKKAEGAGKLIFTDGSNFEGIFKNGKYHFGKVLSP